ncbi:hypothetical protein H4582DRAFT_2126550 [Lactarius indigo]|nr:hypothetical protein H4582DRAFT_2126550 [Lactarius indigo]
MKYIPEEGWSRYERFMGAYQNYSPEGAMKAQSRSKLASRVATRRGFLLLMKPPHSNILVARFYVRTGPFLFPPAVPSCVRTHSERGLLIPRNTTYLDYINMPGSPVVDIRSSFGAAFIGLLVSTTLFGLTIAQTMMYFWHYRNRDPKTLKFFIAFVTIMDGFHAILCAYVIYWYLVLNFGNLENLSSSMWVLNFQIVISIIVGASVEFYYARRVYVVSQSLVCPVLIVVLVIIASFFGICELPALRSLFRPWMTFKLCLPVFTVKETVLKRFSNFHPLTWISCAGMGAGVLADLLVAASMCRSLYHMRTGFARTDSIITTLMAYSINCGLLTCILGTGMTISVKYFRSNFPFEVFLFFMTSS